MLVDKSDDDGLTFTRVPGKNEKASKPKMGEETHRTRLGKTQATKLEQETVSETQEIPTV
jgi:hypothetical protein